MPSLLVITKVPEAPDLGNLAAAIELYFQTEQPSRENDYKGVVKNLSDVSPDLAVASVLNFRTPVFHLGEILVVDGSGREVGGFARKPGKWDVSFEEFDNIQDAVDRSEAVLA